VPIYTFYPQQETGVSPTFETFDLEDDDAVEAVARDVIVRHPSCASVAVWCAERQVGVHRRAPIGPA
jgi:hypothetical protein